MRRTSAQSAEGLQETNEGHQRAREAWSAGERGEGPDRNHHAVGGLYETLLGCETWSRVDVTTKAHQSAVMMHWLRVERRED